MSLRRELTDLLMLLPGMESTDGRQALLTYFGLGDLEHVLDLEGSTFTFAQNLVTTLGRRGKGELSQFLVNLSRSAQVGAEGREKVTAYLAQLDTMDDREYRAVFGTGLFATRGKGRPSILFAALLGVVGVIAVLWWAGGRMRCLSDPQGCTPAPATVGFSPTTDVPETAGIIVDTTEEVLPTADNPSTIGVATAAPEIAARRSITVGYATFQDCPSTDLHDLVVTASSNALLDIDLQASRVFTVSIPDVVAEDRDARRHGEQVDIVIWGRCAPQSDGKGGETVTITSTFLLVGNSPLEAISHRMAQPAAAAVTVRLGEVSSIGPILAAPLAYYAEEEVVHSLSMLESALTALDRLPEATDLQRAVFHWLAGNAYVEHPEYVEDHWPPSRIPNQLFLTRAMDHFTVADGVFSQLAQGGGFKAELAGIRQNMGWANYTNAPGQDELSVQRTREYFQIADSIGLDVAPVIEGLAYTSLHGNADLDDALANCYRLAPTRYAAEYQICLGILETERDITDPQRLAAMAERAREADPGHAMAYFLSIRAQVCLDASDSSGINAFANQTLEVARAMPRWDLVGWEYELDVASAIVAGKVRFRCN